jgi:CheY-like chemotaxis protein
LRSGKKKAPEASGEEAESGKSKQSNSNALFSTLSHELRTPLNGVLGMAQLLRTEEENAQLETLESCAQHMHSVLHTVVNLAKIQTNWGNLPVHREWINLHDLLEQIKKRLARRAMTRRLSIKLHHENTTLRLRVDYDHLIHIIETSILGSLECTNPNVDKETDANESEAELSIKWTASGENIKIEIENPREIMPKDRGLQISKAGELGTTSEETRVRMEFLYWSLSTSLLEHYEGAMLAAKTGDKMGVHTTLAFKMETMAASPSDKRPVGGLSLVTSKTTAGSMPALSFQLKILVVEDDPVNQKLISLFLEKLDQPYQIAVNGEEAIEALTESPDIDLVLMDIDMPVLDGMTASRAIRMGEAGEKASEVPIAALTAFNTLSDRSKFKKAGMEYYLSKPIMAEELRSLVIEIHQKNMRETGE